MTAKKTPAKAIKSPATPVKAAAKAGVAASPAKRTGRPSGYSLDIAKRICTRIALGEGLQPICRDADMPCQASVYKWLLEQPSFAEMYTRAREEQAETHADLIVSIADETPATMEVRDKDGNVLDIKLDSAYIAWQKNRIEARKWTAAKLKPRKYGDRVALAGDADSPIKVEASVEAQGLLDALLKHAELTQQTKASE